MRSNMACGYALIVWFSSVPALWADDDVPDGPAKEALLKRFPTREVEEKLTLHQGLNWINVHTGLRIEVDEQRFAALKQRSPLDESTWWYWSGGNRRADVAVDLFLREFNVDVLIEKERVLLVPKGQGKSILLPPGQEEKDRAQAIRLAMANPFKNEKEIDGAPLDSVLEFVGLRAGVSLAPGVDAAAFKRQFPKRDDIRRQKVNVPVYDRVPLGKVISEVLDQVDGVYTVTDHGVILIQPKAPAKK